MKRYIKTSYNKDRNTVVMNIAVDYYLVADESDLSVSASVGYPQDSEVEYDVAETVLSDFTALIATVKNLFEAYGFISIEEEKSNRPNSESVYILFCYESDYDVRNVEVVFSMRISDHRVPMQRRHKSHDEAEAHMEEKKQECVDRNYLWLNKRLEELEMKFESGKLKFTEGISDELHIPMVMSFIKLNNQQLHNRQAMLRRLKRELIRIKQNYPPTE